MNSNELSSLPNGWIWTRLEEAVEILDSRRIPINADEREKRTFGKSSHELVPYYGATGQVGWIDDCIFDEELVLLGEDGAPFFDPTKPKAYIVRGKSWVNNHAHVLRARNGIPNSYIKYYLDTVDYHGFVTGTTRHKLNQASMRGIPVPLAPPVQQKLIIAEIEKQFSRLDEAVAALKRVRANLKRYKASALKAAVGGRLTEEWRKDNICRGGSRTAPTECESGADLLKRILIERRRKWEEDYVKKYVTAHGHAPKDDAWKKKYKEPAAPDTSNLPELPEGWVWARLDTIADLKGGITVDRKRVIPNSRAVPYLRVANVQRGYLDLSEIKEIQVSESDIKDLRLKRGDILFNEGGDRDKLGRGWIWEDQLPECIHQNHVFRARLLLSDVFPKLVSWWGNSFGKNYFLREGKQTTNLASINMTKLSSFPIPLPSASEQRVIVEEVDRRLSVTEEIEAVIETNLKRAERMRQAILKKAFEGRLVK